MNPFPPLNLNDADLFVPNTEKMIRTYLKVIAASTVEPIIVNRPAWVIAQTTPAPSLIEYTFGEPKDANDQSTWERSQAGYIYLSGRGTWYVKHNSGSAVTFLVKDAGGAAAGDAALAPSLPSSPAAALVPVVWGTPVSQTINAADSAVAAANTLRRALALFNASTGAQRIAVTAQDPATAVIGFVILDPGQGVIFNPADAVTRAKLRAWASAAGGTLIVTEGT